MESKTFYWDTNRIGQSYDIALEQLKEFSKTVEVLHITQGAVSCTVNCFTLFYNHK